MTQPILEEFLVESDEEHEWLVFFDGDTMVRRHPVRLVTVGTGDTVRTSIVGMDGLARWWQYSVDCDHPRKRREHTAPDGLVTVHRDGTEQHTITVRVLTHDFTTVLLDITTLHTLCGDTVRVT
jgi:hypothetical protein